MTDQEFDEVVALVEGYCRVLGVLVPKVKQGKASKEDEEAYLDALTALDRERERMAKGIAEKWRRYGALDRLHARVPGSGPALIPVFKELRDLARFRIIDQPHTRPVWEPRLRQIEWDIRRFYQ
jgi:hypothetical protein